MAATRWLWRLLMLGWMGIIFYLSHQPSLPVPALFSHQDKVFHAVTYGILGFFMLGSLPRHWLRPVLITGLLATLYGLSDEFHQSFIPGRDASLWDLAADAVGAFLGAALMYFSAQRIRGCSPN